MQQSDTSLTGKLDTYVSQFNRQVPALPEGLLSFYMSWAPWLLMIFGGLGFVFFVFGLLFGAILTPVAALGGAQSAGVGFSVIVASVIGLVSCAVDVAGGFMMYRRQLTGWWLVALGMVLALLSDIVGISIVALIVHGLIGYIHLQVRPRYS
jgi:hypothetical protein